MSSLAEIRFPFSFLLTSLQAPSTTQMYNLMVVTRFLKKEDTMLRWGSAGITTKACAMIHMEAKASFNHELEPEYKGSSGALKIYQLQYVVASQTLGQQKQQCWRNQNKWRHQCWALKHAAKAWAIIMVPNKVQVLEE